MLRRLPFTKALRTTLETGTGKPVGLGKFPTDTAGAALPVPYSVLYTIPGTTYDGPPFLDDHADVSWHYQVTGVAENETQVEWLIDKVNEVVLGKDTAGVYLHALTVPGMSVMARRSTDDAGPDDGGAIVSYVVRFAFNVTGV